MATTTKTRKANTYAGRCANCGSRVDAGNGFLGPKIDGRWTVEHASKQACRDAEAEADYAITSTYTYTFNAPRPARHAHTGRGCNGCGLPLNRRGECDECGYMG